MYFLDGKSIYIKPQENCASLDLQLQNCLTQLSQNNSSTKVYKLNFFVNVKSEEEYNNFRIEAKTEISEKFGENILLNFIAQSPLRCQLVLEAFFYDPLIWSAVFQKSGSGETVLFKRETVRFLIGHVQSNEPSTSKEQAKEVFSGIKEIFDSHNFRINSIIRQWNYVENIIGKFNGEQNYQQFNNARSNFYGDDFNSVGYPAATGIGMDCGGIIVEFIALDSNEAITNSVNNPSQIEAHNYSNQVLCGDSLKTTPKFERAKYLQFFDKKLMLISGTASIVGEKTAGTGNAFEQTKTTIQNIQRLYSDEVLGKINSKKHNPKYGHARVYVKNKTDYSAIKRVFKKYYGNLPVVYILADICREELLVEIEGEVIFE